MSWQAELKNTLRKHLQNIFGEKMIARVEKTIDEVVNNFVEMQSPRAREGMRRAFEATPEQLGEAAVAAARKKVDHSRNLCGTPDKPNDFPRNLLADNPAHCLCCNSIMLDVDPTSLGMQQLGIYILVCPLCPKKKDLD